MHGKSRKQLYLWKKFKPCCIMRSILTCFQICTCHKQILNISREHLFRCHYIYIYICKTENVSVKTIISAVRVQYYIRKIYQCSTHISTNISYSFLSRVYFIIISDSTWPSSEILKISYFDKSSFKYQDSLCFLYL